MSSVTLPTPEFENVVPEQYADAFVHRKIESGTLTFIGSTLPISKECAALLPQHKTLTTLNILLETVADILQELITLPNLLKLTLRTQELSVKHCEILANYSGTLCISGTTWYQPFSRLSDGAAKRLAGCKGHLNFSLDQLPESAAAILGQHPSFAEADEVGE